MSQHAGSECNGTHLIQYRRVNFKTILNKENKTFECERHVSATPVPSSVYGWNYNEEQYIVEY